MDDDLSQPREPAGAIFGDALELPNEQRAAFLEKACAGDAALRQRVEALLSAHLAAGAFMHKAPQATGFKTELLPRSLQPGEKIGRYKLLQQIGEGGCGVVSMAEQAAVTWSRLWPAPMAPELWPAVSAGCFSGKPHPWIR